MSTEEEKTNNEFKHKAIGAGVTIGVVGLLLTGGLAGWKANDAMNKPAVTSTPSTVLTASQTPTSTTLAAASAEGK